MGSKKTFKKCKHVFKQGAKKNKKCNANCKGDYCKKHNTSQKEYQLKYQKKYYEENIKKPFEFVVDEKIKRIEAITDIRNVTPSTIFKAEMKLKACNDKCNTFIRKSKGLRLYLGKITEMDLYKPYIQQMFNSGDISKEIFDEAMEAEKYSHIPDDVIKKLPATHKIYRLYEEDSELTEKENQRKAKKQLNQLMKERDKLVEELQLRKEIIAAYKKKREELLKVREEKKEEVLDI